MSKTNPNDPAYETTKREDIAMRMALALVASPNTQLTKIGELAEAGVVFADALIEALNKERA